VQRYAELDLERLALDEGSWAELDRIVSEYEWPSSGRELIVRLAEEDRCMRAHATIASAYGIRAIMCDGEKSAWGRANARFFGDGMPSSCRPAAVQLNRPSAACPVELTPAA
jgi:hypothetical protein